MSNNKQSSVEWLISQLQKSKDWHRVLNEISQMSSARVDIIEQAKAMHRIEILKARQNGLDNGFSNGSWDSQLYYTEEFGGSND